MDLQVIEIDSETTIEPEQHFRISAGPGAGKTHWLVKQIKHVLTNSKRLQSYRKIACITYTNIGVETILKRLDFVADRVEVSTIHAFLYANVVKPYAGYIPDKYELNVARLDGHDDHVISKKRIIDWLTTHPNVSKFAHPYSLNQLTQMPQNLEAVGRWLGSLHYVLDENTVKLIADNGEAYYLDGGQRRNLGKTTCLDKLETGLLDYKKTFWKQGTLHHDDVLFFSCVLLAKYPFILSVLRAKFPYFFVDEFQDTSPIQAKILNAIGKRETIVGIIGDKAQSIYSFQGASPTHFEQFTLPGIQSYLIRDNRRSTNAIINLLNHIRKDIQQKGVRGVEGTLPILFVGDTNKAISEAIKVAGEKKIIATLAWDNISANAMKRKMNSDIPASDLFIELANTDSNTERRILIGSIAEAVELAKRKRFKEAIKEMERNFRDIKNKDIRKRTAFKHLSSLLSKYDSFKSASLFDFHALIKKDIKPETTKLVKGAAFDFYNKYTFEQLAVCIKIVEDNSFNRTIHKAKGDEFDRVFLIVKDKAQLNFLINPNLSAEQQRIFYVAVSRGRDQLYINVPDLSVEDEQKINKLIEVKRLS